MALIFSSFSNNYNRPLPGMEQELPNLIKFFKGKIKEGKLDFEFEIDKTVDELTASLISKQKDLRVFHFSGHSSGDELDFNGSDFTKEHVARFFNSLTKGDGKLQCVFLNGCENEEIVNLLTDVPIVIGTREPVSNQDAIRFTKDFFAALINGEKSYMVAYQQARDNRPDAAEGEDHGIIRGGGSARKLKNAGAYFIRVNKEEVANAKFPLTSPPRAKWPFFVVGLVALLVGGWFFLKGDEIKKEINKFECPVFQDFKKCNILVADFNNHDANEFISEGINGNEILSRYLDAVYQDNYSDLIVKNSIEEAALPDKCNFEYILTGDVKSDEKKIALELIPKAYGISKRESYEIGSLFDFKETILGLTFDEIFDTTIIENLMISKICVACAGENDDLEPVAEAQIERLNGVEGADTIYQVLNEQMASMYFEKEKEDAGLNSLGNVADKDINDRALAARQKMFTQNLSANDYSAAYSNYSYYINSLDARMANPNNFEMKEAASKYQTAATQRREDRAYLVYNHLPTDLDANRVALTDFIALSKITGNEKKYTNEIIECRKRLGIEEDDEDPVIPVKAEICVGAKSPKGSMVKGASVFYNNKKYKLDGSGFACIPCPDKSCFNQVVKISHKEFGSADFKIPGYGIHSVTLKKGKPANTPSVPEAFCLTVKNKKGLVLKGAQLLANNKTVDFDAQGKYCLPCPDKSCNNKRIQIKHKGYQTKNYKIRNTGNYEVVLVAIANVPVVTPTTKNMVLYLIDENKKPIANAKISVRKVRLTSDGAGKFEINAKTIASKDTRMVISANGYEEKKLLASQLSSGQKIVLEKKKVAQRNYTISGKITECGNRTPLSPIITVDGTVLEMGGGNFKTTIDNGQEGQEVVIEAPEGYSFSEGRKKVVRLGATSEISVNENLSFNYPKLKSYSIFGMVTGNNEVIPWATFGFEKNSLDGKVDAEGGLKTNRTNCYCDKLIIEAGEFKQKIIELRADVKDSADGQINLGEIVMTPVNR